MLASTRCAVPPTQRTVSCGRMVSRGAYVTKVWSTKDERGRMVVTCPLRLLPPFHAYEGVITMAECPTRAAYPWVV